MTFMTYSVRNFYRAASAGACMHRKGRKGKNSRNNVHKIRNTLSMVCMHLPMRCSKPKDHTVKREATSVGKSGMRASNSLALWWRKTGADIAKQDGMANDKIFRSPAQA
jgi:hypothetical protein